MEKNSKIADLGKGLEIWQLVISGIKEQDINAQVMEDRRMKILTANIKERGALESLPYVHKQGDTFTIISGHHRVRAANAAGLKLVYCLVDTNEMTRSQITSKQIAHNELVGSPDEEILKLLVKQMNEVDDIIASGLTEKFLDSIQGENPTMDLPQLEFDWRTVTLVFLPGQLEEFDTLARMVDSKSEQVCVADRKQYKAFVDAMTKYGKTQDIRSVTTVVSVLTRLALEKVKENREKQE